MDPTLRFHPDGKHVLCTVCMRWKTVDQLEPVSSDFPLRGGEDGIYSASKPAGEVWDVCKSCAAREKRDGAQF